MSIFLVLLGIPSLEGEVSSHAVTNTRIIAVFGRDMLPGLLTKTITARDKLTFLGILIGISILVIGLRVSWKRLPIDEFGLTLNDQVGYISVARHWLDEGKLNSSIIYPSLLRQSLRRNSLYMPGFYAELALVYHEVGYSAGTSRIPALASFVVGLGLLYGIAWQLYGLDTAVFATMLFAFFPLNLIYAFTAMSETPLQAAALAAFAVFLWAQHLDRGWLGSLALTLPIMFRETGVVLGVVMATMIYYGAEEHRVRRALASGGLSILVLVVLLLSPVGAGRPSLWKANILAKGGFGALYSDAFAAERLSGSTKDWVFAVDYKFISNLRTLISPRNSPGDWLERTSMLFVLSSLPLGFWVGRQKQDGFAVGVVAAIGVLLVADLSLYTVWSYRGIRLLLMMQPFAAMLWGIAITTWIQRKDGSVYYLILIVAVGGVSASVYAMQRQVGMDRRAQENTTFVESVVGHDRRMLVSPFWLSLDYVNEHYPQQWAFVPENCSTLQLLDRRYEIGTLIMPAQPALPEHELCGTRLYFTGERIWRGASYWVYQPRSSGEQSSPVVH